jgi:hypothetical protein
MHYVIRSCYQMQKHKIGVTCPDTLIIESLPVPPEYEKYSIKVSRPRRIGVHYLTRRTNWMQNLKFGTTYPHALLSNPYRSHPSLKNSA